MKKSYIVFLCAILAASSILSCKQPAKDDEKTIAIESVKVEPSSITLEKNGTSTLKAIILPSNAPQEVKWESDAPEKVSVDNNGKILAKDFGNVNITATSLKDSTKSASCVVIVKKPSVAIDVEVQTQDGFVDVSKVLPSIGIPYTATHVEINPAGKFVLKASVKDLMLKDKTILGKVSKPENSSPVTLKPIANNSFELTFSKVQSSTPCTLLFYMEDEEAKKEVEINVLPEPEISKIECTPTEITLGKNFTYQIGAPKLSFEPSVIGTLESSNFVLEATKKIDYQSNNISVAIVSENGEVQTKEQGIATISMKTTNGKEATLKITVENEVSPEKLTISQEYINLKIGQTKDITISPEPSNGSVSITDWTNTNAVVGKIEKKSKNTYKVTALGRGEAVFEASSKYNPSVKLMLHLTVSDKLVESVKIEPPRITLEKDETRTLMASIIPSEAPQKVRWESNNSAIVSVDDDGKITAKDFGVAVIKAISLADGTKTGQCVVNVAALAGSVKLNKELLELKYNESFTLVATIEPSTAPQDVTWSCDDVSILNYTSTGVITAKSKEGKAIITATSTSDASKKATCVVYVAEEKVEKLKLSEDSFEMDTNGEKNFSVEILPSGATNEIEYEIETENLELKKFEKVLWENKYNCTVKSGNLEETKKITFRSKANPELKAILNIKTVAPKVMSVIVENKTISLDTMTEKMTAVVLPSNAVQTVKWTCKNTDIVQIDETSGLLTPIKAGEATIVATSTADEEKKGEAKVIVKASVKSFEVDIDKPSVYFGGETATLTVTPNPLDAFGDFVATSENEDIEITKVVGNDNAFKISVKNKKAKIAMATLKVKSNAASTLAEKTKTIQIKTIVPKTISIKGNEKMYLDEELEFTISATEESYGIEPDKSVKWEYDDSYKATNILYSYYVNVKDDGKVKLKSNYAWNVGKSFRIKATSLLDDSVVDTKVITTYKNVAQITSIECNHKEWTHCKSSNSTIYNGYSGLVVSFRLKNNADVTYKKFVISEDSAPYGKPSSIYLKETMYESLSSYGNSVNISIKSHTMGEKVKFYVWPIDPKTEKPITTGTENTFELIIWAEPEGIEFEEGDFDLYDQTDGGVSSGTLNYGSNNRYFYARITPEYAKQDFLTYTTEQLTANMCIMNDRKAETQDKPGWIKYIFDINPKNQIGGDERAKFNFAVKVNGQSPDPAISKYLRIVSN